MGENSKIEWTDHTFSPWEGCQKVGPGCDHCYAEARNHRFADGRNWGPGAPRRRTSPSNWAQPRAWNRKAQAFRAQHGHWPRVFCASLADVFDNAVDRAWRADLWKLIRDTQDLRWILLTKRIGNVPGMLPYGWLDGGFDHVGIMITAVNQDEADRDVRKLVDLPMNPWQWRGISHEPAIGGVDWSPWIRRLNWIIYGGESGPDARPSHPDWARADRDQCAAVGTAFMMKQWGAWLPGHYSQSRHTALLDPADGPRHGINLGEPPHPASVVHDWSDGYISIARPKAATGRLLDGREHLEFPEALR